MSHHHLEGLQLEWKLIRETSSSSIFEAETSRGVVFHADIHYTSPKIMTISLVVYGPKANLTDGQSSEIFSDLSLIALRAGGYQIIDYTLSFAENKSIKGNYEIDPSLIKFHGSNN